MKASTEVTDVPHPSENGRDINIACAETKHREEHCQNGTEKNSQLINEKNKKFINITTTLLNEIIKCKFYLYWQCSANKETPCLCAKCCQYSKYDEVNNAEIFIAVIASEVNADAHIKYGTKALEINRKNNIFSQEF